MNETIIDMSDTIKNEIIDTQDKINELANRINSNYIIDNSPNPHVTRDLLIKRLIFEEKKKKMYVKIHIILKLIYAFLIIILCIFLFISVIGLVYYVTNMIKNHS
jgi:hypothetical protein